MNKKIKLKSDKILKLKDDAITIATTPPGGFLLTQERLNKIMMEWQRKGHKPLSADEVIAVCKLKKGEESINGK